MKFKIILLLLLVASQTYAQDLYLKTFGDPNAAPIIYLHGGPGYNSTSFEVTTAEKLAAEGFFVIVYDRRGEGRSDKLKAAFTFEETISDLNQIYEKHAVEKATLIGHSFGGIVATLFAEQAPEKVSEIVLLSAPIKLQDIFHTIIDTCEVIYKKNADEVNLNYIGMLKKMDPHSLEYSSYCFMHAMANGFYIPEKMTTAASTLYAEYSQSELFKYANQMSYTAPQGFWEKEKYTSIDLTEPLRKLVAHSVPIYGIYGKEDGLFSVQQIEHITSIIGSKNVHYLKNSAHNPFIDRQAIFLEILTNFTKK